MTQILDSGIQGPVILTGASGRVGARIRPLLSRLYDVRATDIAGNDDGLTRIDLTRRDETVAGFAGAEAVVHCAIAGYPQNDPATRAEAEVIDYHERMFEVNMRGAYHVFEAARVNRIRRVVYISSLMTAMGDGAGFEPWRSSPYDIYACTKLFGENLAEVYHRTHGIEVIVLRLGQPYPIGLFMEKRWEADPAASALFVTMPDIAHAVHAALSARHVRFGKYNVVSENENPRVEVGTGREIGFFPRESWRSATGRDELGEILAFSGDSVAA